MDAKGKHTPQLLPRLGTADELGRMSGDPAGSVRARLANAMVGLKKEFYGRGPEGAKAWILDDYVVVALEGGLTRNEETLLAAGRDDVVRQYRLTFQEAVTETVVSTVEELLGRRVATYHSQILFRPTRTFEIFVLEPEEPDAPESDPADAPAPS